MITHKFIGSIIMYLLDIYLIFHKTNEIAINDKGISGTVKISCKLFFLLAVVKSYSSSHNLALVRMIYTIQYIHEGIAAIPVHISLVNSTYLSKTTKLSKDTIGQT